jgi:FkbM family methyltransferase
MFRDRRTLFVTSSSARRTTSVILSLMARRRWQPLWRLLFHAAIGGLGHMNPNPHRNGEDRYLAQWARELQAQGRSRPVVVDIGANEGEFTASVLALLPETEVHCFEPHPVTNARLTARFGDYERVHVNAMGVGDSAGVLALHDYQGSTGTAHASFLPQTFTDVYAAESETVDVPVTTVDDYLERHEIRRADLMKVDVEGFERSVLLGMQGALAAGRVDRVQFEFNAHNALTGLTLHEIGQLLPGFDIYKLLADGQVRILGSGVAYDSRIEIYKYANYVAVRRAA